MGKTKGFDIRQEYAMRWLFADPPPPSKGGKKVDPLAEPAEIAIKRFHLGLRPVSANDIMRDKLLITGDDIPPELLDEFHDGRKAIIQERAAIAMLIQDGGYDVCIINSDGHSTFAGRNEPYGFDLRESAAGLEDRRAQIQRTSAKLAKQFRAGINSGQVTREEIQAAATKLLDACLPDNPPQLPPASDGDSTRPQ